jgi:glycosyltransferase involved in cell wall biosynthesis
VIISIVIATRDRAPQLAATLEAVAAQTSPEPFEIVVVDNLSKDGTAEVVAAAARTGVPVLYIYEPKSGKSHALNTAISRTRGDLLVFIDDDVLPSPGWLAAYAHAFGETAADFAAGRILPLWEEHPPAWMSPALHGVLSIADGGTRRLSLRQGAKDGIMPLGANMAVRRYVIERIGGWNTDLGKLQGTLRTGEDHDFFLRMVDAGFQGVFEPEAVVRHRVPGERLTLRYFRRWFYDNGKVDAQMEQRHPTTDTYLFRVPRYLWRQAVVDASDLLVGLVTFNVKRIVSGITRLEWLAGYVLYSWTSRRRRSISDVAARAATLPRG